MFVWGRKKPDLGMNIPQPQDQDHTFTRFMRKDPKTVHAREGQVNDI